DISTDADTSADADAANDSLADADVPEPSCPVYHKLCGGICVNTTVNPLHCGACDEACDPGQVCSGGTCSSECLPGLLACGQTCVDPLTDPAYCGGCSTICEVGEGCVNGSCKPAIPVGPGPANCDGFGPPIVVPTPGGDVCLSETAQVSFTWGLCSCAEVALSNQITTDAYDSTQGGYAPGGVGGGVGVRGKFSTSNKVAIGGTLWVSGSGGAQLGNTNDIAVNLHVGGPLATGGASTVGGDAWVVGTVTANQSLAIQGTLHHTQAAAINGPVTHGALVKEAVSVASPCPCEPEDLVPVVAIVAAHTTDNDNATIGLSADALINPSGPVSLTLPCGRYYLSGIKSSQDISIVATGRTALFIDGVIETSGKLQITPSPTGELDVLIAGKLDLSNELRLGSPAFPALLRVYVGSTEGITLSNKLTVGAFVYAAAGPVRLSNQLDLYGGLVVGSLDASNKLQIHYDRAVLQSGSACPDPSGLTCDVCGDCGNQACTAEGVCGACSDGADCCPPLICQQGTCVSSGGGFTNGP
ncbi:MAG: hypothetical protein R3F39_25955, partial [Myxococcota bacterium]